MTELRYVLEDFGWGKNLAPGSAISSKIAKLPPSAGGPKGYKAISIFPLVCMSPSSRWGLRVPGWAQFCSRRCRVSVEDHHAQVMARLSFLAAFGLLWPPWAPFNNPKRTGRHCLSMSKSPGHSWPKGKLPRGERRAALRPLLPSYPLRRLDKRRYPRRKIPKTGTPGPKLIVSLNVGAQVFQGFQIQI